MLKNKEEIQVWLDNHGVDNCSINDDMTVDVKGSVNLYDFGLTDLPVQFTTVSGDFECSENQLKSLAGSPRTVGGSFSCYRNLLEDLNGGPVTVGEDMNCQRNRLFTLDGAPRVIGGTLYCVDNPLAELGDIQTAIGSRYIGPLITEFREYALDHAAIEVEAGEFNSAVKIRGEKRLLERQLAILLAPPPVPAPESGATTTHAPKRKMKI